MKKDRDIHRHNREFKAFMMRQDEPMRRYFSAIIRRACIIDYPKYVRWLNSTSRIDPLYRKKIEEVTGQKIFTDE